jgi:hypothetical protein
MLLLIIGLTVGLVIGYFLGQKPAIKAEVEKVEAEVAPTPEQPTTPQNPQQ